RLVGEPQEGSDGGTMVKRGLLLGTKLDLPEAREKLAAVGAAGYGLPIAAVSAASGEGLEEFKQAVFDALRIIRVYTKEPGKQPDLERPYVLPRGSTVLDVARAIHQDFAEKLRYAQLWGSGKFAGQRVPRDHQVQDGDVVELHI
ncbi:MAG: TGS domain-containing protein, partial [Candidatus Bipolaricaulia bacterium]